MKSIENYIKSFGKGVIKRARIRLSRNKKNVSKTLYNSLDFKVKMDEDFKLTFFMADYGQFIDQGVSGRNKGRTYTSWKLKTERSDFAYTSSMPPPSALDKWIVRKGLAPRDESGRFKGRSVDKVGFRKSISFLMARKIFFQGIQGISFFSEPIGLELKKLPPNLLEIVEKDVIETFVKLNTK